MATKLKEKKRAFICMARNHITIGGKRYNYKDQVEFSEKELEDKNLLRLVKRFFRPDVGTIESKPIEPLSNKDGE